MGVTNSGQFYTESRALEYFRDWLLPKADVLGLNDKTAVFI